MVNNKKQVLLCLSLLVFAGIYNDAVFADSAAVTNTTAAVPTLFSNTATAAALSGLATDTSSLGGKISSFFSQAASTLSTGVQNNFTQAKELMPFLNFLIYLPRNLRDSLTNNSYFKSKFTIENKNASDAQQTFGIEYDLGFEGSGDINEPINFTFYNGAFYFKKVSARLYPEAFSTTQEDGTVVQQMRSDIRQPPFSVLIPALLQTAFGQPGLDAWTYLLRIMNPYPEDIVVFKLLSLFSSINGILDTSDANSTSISSTANPSTATLSDTQAQLQDTTQKVTLEQVPMELMALFSRMAKTPNIKATMSAHPAGVRSNSWDPDKIIFLDGPLSFITSQPKVVRDFLDQLKMSMSEGEQQEYNDLKGKNVTSAQLMYGKLRTISAYEDRSNFITKQFLPLLKNSISPTKTDAVLLIYALKRHFLERLDHLQNFLGIVPDVGIASMNNLLITGLLQGMASNGSDQTQNSLIVDAASNSFDGTLSTASITALQQKLSSVNSAKVRALLLPRYTHLKELGTKLTEIFQTTISDTETADFFKTAVATLDAEVGNIAQAIEQLTQALAQGESTAINEQYQNLRKIILDVANPKYELTYKPDWGQTLQLPLTDFLRIKYFNFEQLSFKKFNGDLGYYQDDSLLSELQAASLSMAILLRAKKDLLLAEAKFKTDDKGQYMIDTNGERKLVKGKEIYEKYYAQPVYLFNKVSEQLSSVQQNLSNAASSVNINVGTQNESLKTLEQKLLNDLQSAKSKQILANKEYQHFLRQFRLDRRDLSGSVAGKPFTSSMLRTITTSQETIKDQSSETEAKQLIAQYNFYGESALVRVDALMLQKKIEQEFYKAQNGTQQVSLESQIAEKNAAIQKNQTDLTNLQALQKDYETKTATTDQSAGPSLEQTMFQQELVKVQAGIGDRQVKIESLKTEVADLTAQIKNLTQDKTDLQNGLTAIQAIVSNQSLKVASLEDTIASNPLLVKLQEKMADVTLSNSNYINIDTKVRNLIKVAANTAETSDSQVLDASPLTFNTVLFEQIVQKLESGFGITEQSLLGSTLQQAKQATSDIPNKLLMANIDYKTLDADFVKALSATTSPQLLKDTKGFCAAMARAGLFALTQILSSTVGLQLFRYLKDTVLPEWRLVIKGETPATSAINFGQVDAVDLLLVQKAGTTTPTSPDDMLQKELGVFLNELKTLLNNSSFWQASMWEDNVFTQPKDLPLDGNVRLNTSATAISNVIQNKKAELVILDGTYELLQGIIYLTGQLYYQANKNLANMLTLFESWAKKINLGAAGNNQYDAAAIQNLKQLWGWFKAMLPNIFCYARFFIESGIYTSANDFLVSEFADVLFRAKQFAQVAPLYLNTILQRSLGMNFQTLLSSVMTEQSKLADLATLGYTRELAALGINSTNLLNTTQATAVSVYSNLDNLSDKVDGAIAQNIQDISQVEANVNNTVAQLSKQVATTPTLITTDQIASGITNNLSSSTIAAVNQTNQTLNTTLVASPPTTTSTTSASGTTATSATPTTNTTSSTSTTNSGTTATTNTAYISQVR